MAGQLCGLRGNVLKAFSRGKAVRRRVWFLYLLGHEPANLSLWDGRGDLGKRKALNGVVDIQTGGVCRYRTKGSNYLTDRIILYCIINVIYSDYPHMTNNITRLNLDWPRKAPPTSTGAALA